ncbi:hypothetical protein C8R44DRAFT_739324 [Mycena epipterygia]|nr:hypothetical protein C8R44DRAFT_739324 [Mycena epipterygia]
MYTQEIAFPTFRPYLDAEQAARSAISPLTRGRDTTAASSRIQAIRREQNITSLTTGHQRPHYLSGSFQKPQPDCIESVPYLSLHEFKLVKLSYECAFERAIDERIKDQCLKKLQRRRNGASRQLPETTDGLASRQVPSTAFVGGTHKFLRGAPPGIPPLLAPRSANSKLEFRTQYTQV